MTSSSKGSGWKYTPSPTSGASGPSSVMSKPASASASRTSATLCSGKGCSAAAFAAMRSINT